ncbi:MAG: hypothetical protein ACKVOY_14655 [Burkholderiaceae bacterium]
MLKVVPTYAALLAFFYVYLSARTIGVRRKVKIGSVAVVGSGRKQRLV